MKGPWVLCYASSPVLAQPYPHHPKYAHALAPDMSSGSQKLIYTFFSPLRYLLPLPQTPILVPRAAC